MRCRSGTCAPRVTMEDGSDSGRLFILGESNDILKQERLVSTCAGAAFCRPQLRCLAVAPLPTPQSPPQSSIALIAGARSRRHVASISGGGRRATPNNVKGPMINGAIPKFGGKCQSRACGQGPLMTFAVIGLVIQLQSGFNVCCDMWQVL